MNNPQTLPELLHPAQIPIIAVAVDADGDIEFDLIVGIIGLRLADIPWDAGAAEHDAGEGVVKGIGGVDDTDTFCAPNPDAVVGEQLLSFIDAITELSRPLVDIIKETEREVLRDATRADIGGVEPSARDALIKLLEERLKFGARRLWVCCGSCSLPLVFLVPQSPIGKE